MNKFFLLASLCLVSCSYSTYYVPPGQGVYPPRDPDQVAISTQKTLQGNYKSIARVAALSWGSGESAREALQKEAARVGANLVIDFRIERASGRTAASGLAVFVYQKE